jgi:hypothetical protein
MKKRTSGRASGRTLRSRRRDIRADWAIARSAAAVLWQLYQWQPGLEQTGEGSAEPGTFDVHAVFDELHKK